MLRPIRSIVILLALTILLAGATPLWAKFSVRDVAADCYTTAAMEERVAQGALDKIKDGVIHEYSGPLSEADEITSFRKRIPTIRKEALKLHREAMGIPKDFTAHCFVVISDRPEGDKSGNNMSTTSREVGATSYGIVSIYTDSLVSGRVVPEDTLVHEINHALLREYLGPIYRETPRWFREGLAVYIAGQGERRMRVLMAGKLASATRSPALGALIVPTLINGLDDAHDFDDYAEDFLLMEFATKENPNAIAEMVAALKAGENTESAYAKSVSLEWKDAQAVALDYARRRLYALEDGDYLVFYKAMKRVLALSNARDDDKGRPAKLKAEIAKVDKELGYQAKKPIADQPYTSVVWAYQRAIALASIGENADAAKDLIQEVSGDDGILRETTLTALSVRRIVDYSIADNNLDQAEEWAKRLQNGFTYSASTIAYAEKKLQEIAAAR